MPIRFAFCLAPLLIGLASALSAAELVPTLTTSTTTVGANEAFSVDLTFKEEITDLSIYDFASKNALITAAEFPKGKKFTLKMTPTGNGDISLFMPSNRVQSVTDAKKTNAASNKVSIQYTGPLETQLSGAKTSDSKSFDLYVSFSEAVAGLGDKAFEVKGGTASRTVSTSAQTQDTHLLSLQNRFYKTTITADAPGLVEVRVKQGVTQSTGAVTKQNQASGTLRIQCTYDERLRWTINDAAEWSAATGKSTNLKLANGFAEPTADRAIFSSVVKKYPQKQKAATVTFKQSPVWNNWKDVPNVGPAKGPNGEEVTNAPIFVPLGKDNYLYITHMKGRSSGYHAWQSSDMVDWKHLGLVAPTATTSAEYLDGKLYLYTDEPRDQNQTVIIDSDLSDNKIAKGIKDAFVKMSGGSDSGVFRDNADGLFHMVYEEHTPIDAAAASFDSPLAGHMTSPDGIHGWQAHEHLPIVDFRAKLTDRFANYRKGGASAHFYQVADAPQNAFGDWTMIKVGRQYYLFGDYDEHGHGIKVGRLTGTSLYERFEFAGSFGDGHPDPTVGFAEGQFYLLTQQDTDHVSPGPWVEGVEARAGVDIDGNGVVDQWTDWQTVSERYAHNPEYVRIVDVTPAQIDLSALPEGYGFQFEFRIDNTVVPGVPPIMDSVELLF